ncbi:phosphatases II [Hesseltinella vesiculosa]|uniref:protein-tyrosine-phosphatase n=1 Tax=Hesseltinella vesiculosa TaxID=101127 RepID=A0A1X2GCQ5_9FUNG|nr:phosphatases II [Hesseltinella vesiculosa]
MVHVNEKLLNQPTTRTDSPLGRMLTVIECPNTHLQFLILDCPTESTLGFYLHEFLQISVHSVVRCCQPTYQAQRLTEHGIQVVDLPFKDGGLPPANVIRDWLQLVETVKELPLDEKNNKRPVIAVHCVAGLGRAPVLVAIALIEMGMKPLDAVEFIRSKRRGAFNKPQIMYLDSYKRQLKPKSSTSNYSLFGRMFKLGSSKSNKANEQ